MTQATDRSNSTNGKGFQPQPQTSTHSSAGHVAAEIGQIRAKVDQAIGGQALGIETLVSEYTQEVQQLADDASQLIYDMLSGRTLFNQIGANVGQLMAAHPTMERPALGKRRLQSLSLQPLNPAIPQTYLNSAANETER
jgi:hypothetical protein